jgi:hypothetical protein
VQQQQQALACGKGPMHCRALLLHRQQQQQVALVGRSNWRLLMQRCSSSDNGSGWAV